MEFGNTFGVQKKQKLKKSPPAPQGVYAVKIRSALVGGDLVVFRGKGNYARVKRDFPNDIIYFDKEIERLEGAPRELIKEIHKAKRVFEGSFCVNTRKILAEKRRGV